MKLIAVGDNVTDCYLDEGIYYPGGNQLMLQWIVKETAPRR